MTFDEYESELRNYHFHSYDLATVYDYFSLCEVVGNLSNKIKKFLETDDPITEVDRQKFSISIGDIIMWCTFMLNDMGMTLDNSMELNLRKCLLAKKKMIEEQQKEFTKNNPKLNS